MVTFSQPLILGSLVGSMIGMGVLLKHNLAGSILKVDPTVLVDGKVFVVTGSNTGIGKETVRELAKRKGTVYMACRNMDLCEKAREEIVLETKNPKVRCMECDLSDFDSIRKFAQTFKAVENKLDVLINNAGVMRCPRTLTKQGLEMQLGVNHMGHFLLTKLLLDNLKNAAPSRIVNLSSVAHIRGKINFDDLNSEQSYKPGEAYNQSKLANLLFTRELAKRLEGTGVTVNAVHPGIVYTDLGRHMGVSQSWMAKIFVLPMMRLFMKTPAEGSHTTLYVALDPELEDVTGSYFTNSEEASAAPAAQDDVDALRLWKTSEKWTGENFL